MGSIVLEPDTPETRKLLNQLARESMKRRLLEDIRFDLDVCRLEDWDPREYVRELAGEILRFAQDDKGRGF